MLLLKNSWLHQPLDLESEENFHLLQIHHQRGVRDLFSLDVEHRVVSDQRPSDSKKFSFVAGLETHMTLDFLGLMAVFAGILLSLV